MVNSEKIREILATHCFRLGIFNEHTRFVPRVNIRVTVLFGIWCAVIARTIIALTRSLGYMRGA